MKLYNLMHEYKMFHAFIIYGNNRVLLRTLAAALCAILAAVMR
jgi:hypothetical protein